MLNLTIFHRTTGYPDYANIYPLTRTTTGWRIDYRSGSFDCDKAGSPYLIEHLERDDLHYPSALPKYMSLLWDKVDEEGLSEEEIQASLNHLAAWINLVENNVPVWRDRKYI